MLLDRPRVEQSGQASATFDGDNIDDDGSVGYDDSVVGHDKNDDGYDDIYIMMQCLSVCVSRKIITSSWESPVTT